MNIDMKHSIAKELACLWETLSSDSVLEYLQRTYGVSPEVPPRCAALHLIQVCEGEVDRGPTGVLSGSVDRRWAVDDTGLRDDDGSFDPDEKDGSFFRHPVVKFYEDAGRVLLSERLGPEFICRRKGNVVTRAGGGVELTDVEVSWTSSPHGKK